MGYWYSVNDANFIIPADKVDEAYDRLIPADAEDSYTVVGNAPATPDNLPDLLRDLGFSADTYDATGDVAIWGGSSKYRFRFGVIERLADLVPDESYLIWQGEEGGDFVRQIVRNGKVEEQQGRVTFGGF